AVSVAQLDLGGLFISQASLYVSTTWAWGYGAGLVGPGTATVGPQATLTIDGAATYPSYSYLLGGRQLINEGTAYFHGLDTTTAYGAIAMGGGASVINNHIFYLDGKTFGDLGIPPPFLNQAYGTLPSFPTTGALSFVNNGTLIKTGVGSGGCYSNVAFDNNGT